MSSFPLAVYIQQHSSQSFLPSTSCWEQWFQQWVNCLQDNLPWAKEYELTLCLTDDAEMTSFNAQYRHKNQPTDVLAFASLETPFPDWKGVNFRDEPLYLGDMMISVETAQKQAGQHHHSLTQELAWLAVHGLLHLLGWDHPDQESLEKMLAVQERLLIISGHKSKKFH